MDIIGLDALILSALREDIGTGDITTACCIPEDNRSEARFLAKADGVVCGIGVAARVFHLLDARTALIPCMKDGDRAQKGALIAELRGPSRGILTGERVALNLMQRLSGIATATAAAVEAMAGTGAKICDTRKSVPGLRMLEKYAVRVGGGRNHRFNLADGVLIKDNHIAASGGIAAAVRAARDYVPHGMKIEVEAGTLGEVGQALEAGADIILLDNMSVPQMRAAVALVSGRALTEASGNMGERDLAEVAKTGVDFISVGALTHSVKALDISLRFK
ncbi:MAG: carboxylating nicotinate-nucleotide diphosphorylase [Oscillospiraceae bacterium]|jgi:nicotinate-nucleotide pyrophosphorylase (carboxylating)|nr:carboxylating nicotinate-nucleotide diphosphorylase [Oscillospiraceae bacterium]